MRSPIKNIYYFGSLADGFKVYPNDSHLNNIFSTYYNNTETDWFLNVNNDGQSVLYTYVRYGLLTSMNGRTGSCFGIAIEFENSYFIDFDIFIKKIIETIIEIFLNEKILISQLPNSEIIGFKAYNLSEVSTYLDEMTLRISEFINSKYSNYISPIHNIKKSNNLTFIGLNNKSPKKVIKETFELSGSIKISPKLPPLTKTIAQKEDEEKKSIQKRLEETLRENKKKENDIKDAKLENENLKKKIEAIESENKTLKNDINDAKSEINKQALEILDYKSEILKLKSTKNKGKIKNGDDDDIQKGENSLSPSTNQEGDTNEDNDSIVSYLKNPKVIGILVLFVLFLLVIVSIFFSDEQVSTDDTYGEVSPGSITHETNCNFDINSNSNPQKWTYNGSNIHTSKDLASYVKTHSNFKDCDDWDESLNVNIDYLNKKDVIEGKITSNKNIVFCIPQNARFIVENESGFKKISN